MTATYDIAIVGGGINGCGIARDAAGRGWRVFLCEQGDLGGATSSASTKLVHGGLRYLEHYEFRLVREALIEREVLLSIAPHIVWPLRFVLPHHAGLRPAWLLRLGLFLYDHLGGRRRLPPTRSLDLRRAPAGRPLKPVYRRGFEYSDCWVEDARLVVLNARDAADKGAAIMPRTRCLGAARQDGLWHVALRDERTGAMQTVTAATLVNAAGPWVDVVGCTLHTQARARTRLVQGSHLVVPRLYDHDGCYILQNADGRIFFIIPYEREFTLIGTTDLDFHGDPAAVDISAAEIDYLCRGASEYLSKPVMPADVVWAYSGVRPLYDDGASQAQEATRDYVLDLDAPEASTPLLTVFGGKITTYRRLAEAALSRLAPRLPAATAKAAGWTGREPLPGGDFPIDGFEALVMDVARRYPFLPVAQGRRLARAYGTRAFDLLGAASGADDLGRRFGPDLTEAEVRYQQQAEWAMRADDVVWRRTKAGLRMTADEIATLEAFMQGDAHRL